MHFISIHIDLDQTQVKKSWWKLTYFFKETDICGVYVLFEVAFLDKSFCDFFICDYFSALDIMGELGIDGKMTIWILFAWVSIFFQYSLKVGHLTLCFLWMRILKSCVHEENYFAFIKV